MMVKRTAIKWTGLIALVLAAIFVLTAATPVSASAASKTKIKDVSKGDDYYSEVMTVYKAGGLDGFIDKNGNLGANKYVKRYEFTRIAVNLYGDRVKVKSSWLTDDVVTQEWANSMIKTLSKQLGCEITWSGGSKSAKVTRSNACFWYKWVLKYIDQK